MPTKRDPDGLTPRFLANVTEREARVIGARIAACVVAAAFATLFLEDISSLRAASWPKGWPTLVSPLTMARLILVGGTGLGLALALAYLTRRRGSWLLLPGVGLFRTALSLAPRAYRPSELELAKTSDEAFWVVRRGEPTWLRPMIVPFKGEAQRELFERWLSERPYDYADMLGPFALVESGDEALTKSEAEGLGDFALVEPDPQTEGVEPEGNESGGSETEAPAEPEPPTPEEPAPDTAAPEAPPPTRELQVARGGRFWAAAGIALTLLAVVVVTAELRYGEGLKPADALYSGSAAFVSDLWKLGLAAAVLLFMGLAGFARPGRVLLLGDRLLVAGGSAFPIRPETTLTLGGGRIRVEDRAWTVGRATATRQRAEVAWDGNPEAEAALAELGVQLRRGGSHRPFARAACALVGLAGLLALGSLVVRDLPLYTVSEVRDRHHQQAVLIRRVSDGALRGLVVSRPPIQRPGARARFGISLQARAPSWRVLFGGGEPEFVLDSSWPTELEQRVRLEVPQGAVLLTRGTELVATGRIRLEPKLEEEIEEGWRGVPGLLEGRLSPESPAELRDFAAGFSSVREFLVEDSHLSLRWVLDHGEIRWIDLAPKPQGVTGIPLARRLALRWNPPAWTEEKNLRPQARRTGTTRGYYETKLPTSLQLLEATQAIRAGEAGVREAIEPLLPGLWPPAPPPRRRGSGGSRQ